MAAENEKFPAPCPGFKAWSHAANYRDLYIAGGLAGEWGEHDAEFALASNTDEMARNGCKKIIIVNGHGGDGHLLPYFAQTQLATPHVYVVYIRDGHRSRAGGPGKKSTGMDWHAGEIETSTTLVTRPDLVHLDRAKEESATDLGRQHLPEDLYTGIWWYARFPNPCAGDGSVAREALGQWNLDGFLDYIDECIRAVKADDVSLKLQNEFYEPSQHPLDTKQ